MLIDTVQRVLDTQDDDLIRQLPSQYHTVLTWITGIRNNVYTIRRVITDGSTFVELLYDIPNTYDVVVDLNMRARQVQPIGDKDYE